MTTGEKAGQVISDRLWQIAFAVAATGCGFMIAQTQSDTEMRKDLERIEGGQAEILQRLRGRHGFMNDSNSRMNFLCQAHPECKETFKPMMVPE